MDTDTLQPRLFVHHVDDGIVLQRGGLKVVNTVHWAIGIPGFTLVAGLHFDSV